MTLASLSRGLVVRGSPFGFPRCNLFSQNLSLCSAQGQTLTSEIAQASIVVYGSLTNAKLDANAAFGQGTTDLKIEKILKSHEILGDQKSVTLPRYLPVRMTTNACWFSATCSKENWIGTPAVR